MTYNLHIIAAVVSVLLGLAAVVRKRDTLASWCFFGGMVVFGAESMLTGLLGQRIDQVFALVSEGTSVDEVVEATADLGGMLKSVLIAKAFLPGVWLCFSLTYSRGNYREFLTSWKWLVGGAFLLPVFCFVFRAGLLVPAPETGEAMAELIRLEGPLALMKWGTIARLLHVVVLGSVIVVMMNLEKTFRTTVGTMRWRVKFLLMGIALVLGVRIYTLSQALLFPGFDQAMAAWGTLSLLVAAPLIAIGYLRKSFSDIDIYPSRGILQGSITVLLAGGYLFVIGVLAQLVSFLGRSGSFQLQAIVILGGLVGLACLLLSERARLKIRQFVSHHFRRPHHDFRKVWSDFTRRTALADRTSVYRETVGLVADTFTALTVVMFVRDAITGEWKIAAATEQAATSGAELSSVREASRVRVPMTSAATDAVLVDSIVKTAGHRPFDLDEIDLRQNWANLLKEAVPGQFATGGRRICVPLIAASSEHLLGLIVLADRVNAMPYSVEEMDLLECIGHHTAAGLQNSQLTENLMRARELEAFQTMSTFFVHDLKNAASSLNLMLQNLPTHFDDPEFREDALRSIGRTVDRIKSLIARLSALREKLEIHTAPAELNTLIEEVVGDVATPDAIMVRADLTESLPKVLIDREQIRSVLTNLVQNAADALESTGGNITISSGLDGRAVMVSVADDGCGISPEFLKNSLFRPFQSTKKNGLGIGMFQSKMIVDTHGGSMQVTSVVGEGTTFSIRFSAMD